VSFRDARFVGPAWFYHARFGATAAFTGAYFAGRVQLDQPTVDVAGAQFHGTTRFDGSRFDRTVSTLDGPSGRATFHGDVVFAGEPPADVVVHGTVR
jgi:hypothetical protein